MSKHRKSTHKEPRERMFFNRHPLELDEHNDIESLLEDFETVRQVKKRRNQRVDVLERSQLEEDVTLHDVLSGCGRHPCNSAACPICFRQFRKWFFAEGIRLFNTFPNAHMLTIIYYSEMMTDTQLKSFSATRLHNRLRKQLERAGFRYPVMGCLEFDYHEENGLWQPHYHLLTFDDKATVKKLRNVFSRPSERRKNSSAKVGRPVLASKIRNPVEQISYMCKTYSSRVTASVSSKGKRNTYKHSLRTDRERLILRTMHRIGFQQLLFLFNARRNGSQLKYSVSTTKV